MPTVVVKNHVRDSGTGETFLRGSHEVDDVQAYRLTSEHPENVVDADSENKESLVEAARDAGVEVKASDSKSDVAKKLSK
jgi:hypothetical protein